MCLGGVFSGNESQISNLPRPHRPGGRNGWRAIRPSAIKLMARRDDSVTKRLGVEICIDRQRRRQCRFKRNLDKTDTPNAIVGLVRCSWLHQPLFRVRLAKSQRCNRPTHFSASRNLHESETPAHSKRYRRIEFLWSSNSHDCSIGGSPEARPSHPSRLPHSDCPVSTESVTSRITTRNINQADYRVIESGRSATAVAGWPGSRARKQPVVPSHASRVSAAVVTSAR